MGEGHCRQTSPTTRHWPPHRRPTARSLTRIAGSLSSVQPISPFGAIESDYQPSRWRRFREYAQFTEKEADIELGVTYFGARRGGFRSNPQLQGERASERIHEARRRFGMKGNWNPGQAAEFSRAVNQHINDPIVAAIAGTYHGAPGTHYFNPSTGVNVMVDSAGNFVSGWRLGADLMGNVLRSGALQ